MTHEEEMNYREELLSRVRNGEKITSEDRLWLQTHRVVNLALGYPYLNRDIIHLHPKMNYIIRVKVESLTYPDRILPIVGAPGGKGKIVADIPLVDYKGNVTLGKPVKMLGVPVDLNDKEFEFAYQSDLGLLEVSYECDYFDDQQHLKIHTSSNTGNTSFAMFSEVLADNKIRYRCKAPTNDSFESFVFSIEWKIANQC